MPYTLVIVWYCTTYNKTGGYLVRTKSVNVNEGGVATGYAALDSIYLE